MRGLMTAVIGMGVLIAVGATVLVVLMVQRMSASPAPIASMAAETATSIGEPADTRIASIAITGDRLALQLTGGGPDRVVIVDTRVGRVVARTSLGR